MRKTNWWTDEQRIDDILIFLCQLFYVCCCVVIVVAVFKPCFYSHEGCRNEKAITQKQAQQNSPEQGSILIYSDNIEQMSIYYNCTDK